MTTAQTILRDAARAVRAGEWAWGRDVFVDPVAVCRCAAGFITLAADPNDIDGDPFNMSSDADPDARHAAGVAASAFATYLVEVLGAVETTEAVETIGGWNDEPERTVDEVADALDGAADWLDGRAAA